MSASSLALATAAVDSVRSFVLGIAASIAEVLEGTLDVFPVPAQTNLHVIWNGPTIDNAFVTLRDASGRVVRVAQVSERDVLDVSNLASGAYTLDFTVPSRGTLQRRIMVQ